MRRLFVAGLLLLPPLTALAALAPPPATDAPLPVTEQTHRQEPTSQPATGQQASSTSPIHQQKIIEIKGVELPDLLGEGFANLTLFTVQQGMLMPIPHQCEDFDDEGYSWFKQSATPLRGREGVIDAHDSLLFRFADAGQRLSDESARQASKLVEIRITAGSDTRYVYASRQPTRFSYSPLASYDSKTGRITTDYYTLQTAPDNLLQWSDFTYRNFQGLPNNTLLDTLKIRLEAGVVLNDARVTLDNQNLDTRIVATKAGPIRTVLLAESRMNFAGIPVVYMDLQMQVYPQQINIDAKVNVPSVLKRLLKNPTATVTLDGHNLDGSELRSSVASQAVTVDGKMSPDESALASTPVGQHPWVWLSSHKGFDIFATLYIPPNFAVPVNLNYQDSQTEEDTPERFPGQGPNVGFHMQDVPVNDTFHFAFQAWFTDTLAGVPPAQLASALSRMPLIAAQTLPQRRAPLQLVHNNH